MYEAGVGILVGLGVVQERRACRLTLVYGCPLLASDGTKVTMVRWTIRRDASADGFDVWTATAEDSVFGVEPVMLDHLSGSSMVQSVELRSVLRMIGLRGAALNALRRCGTSAVTNLRRSSARLPELAKLRLRPWYYEEAGARSKT